MRELDINFIAILVAGIDGMIIGSLWYGPIFGKLWMKEVGKTEEDLREGFNPGKTYGLAALGHLVIAFVLAFLLDYVNAVTIIGAVMTAFWTWLGFVAATMFINHLFSGKSLKLYLLDSGYHLVVILTMSIILTIWV
jgi:hypothetical protein